MAPTNTIINLEKEAERYNKRTQTVARRIIICAGTGCVANGSLKIFKAFEEEIEKRGLDVTTRIDIEGLTPSAKGKSEILLSKSGCQGFCQMGPLVTIEPEGIFYVLVKAEDVPEIVEKTLINNEVIERLLYKVPSTGKRCETTGDIPFYALQKRTVLKKCGYINPDDINEYIARNGYKGARKAFLEMSSVEVCAEILKSGLRGRGGGGFPTGKKWQFTLAETNDKKYVICNGDEGDPGAFMDRSIMEGNPHSILEGMMIAARAIGADEGYVYVRAEYPLAVDRVKKAIIDARRMGILGNDVLGSGKKFDIEVMEGAGAFVCGEETALMASIEGKRGMPNPKPPFPAQKGLWGKPTVINNVETLATVPLILEKGADYFLAMGTEKSPGTKTFALTGHVANTGLIEVPLGITLREIIYDIGGGVTHNDGTLWEDGFKAVQIGGPSGGCLTEEHLDLPLDFDSLTRIGAMVGSGGLVVMNKDTCMIRIARFFMQFTQNESCGKCVLCREGTKQMLSLLDDIIEGRAEENTLIVLKQLALAVKKGSLCGLGKTAPNPILSTMNYFYSEYKAHVFDKLCPTGECKALRIPVIDAEKCKGCTLCARKCPVGAISGERKKPHHIDPEKCIRCGACIAACKFNAIA